jgi:cation transport regulator ChaC
MASAPVLVFGYASLVSPASVSTTLGHEIDPGGFSVARLLGWRRAWNVGSDRTSHPERTLVRSDGTAFAGVTAVLGLVPADDSGCDGAVFAVTPDDLALLDVRERNYDRVDVTAAVGWPGKPAGCVVFTYVPRESAIERLRAAQSRGRPVRVRAGYLQLVETAFTAIGRLEVYRGSTSAPPFPVEELRIVVDPAAGDVPLVVEEA